MPGTSSLVQLKTVHGLPIAAGDVRVIPESQVLVIRSPFGGLVWQRPTAVAVEHVGRARQRIPIVDLTRVAQVSLLLGTLLVTAMCLIASSRPQEP
jgi:hypothetical protein